MTATEPGYSGLPRLPLCQRCGAPLHPGVPCAEDAMTLEVTLPLQGTVWRTSAGRYIIRIKGTEGEQVVNLESWTDLFKLASLAERALEVSDRNGERREATEQAEAGAKANEAAGER